MAIELERLIAILEAKMTQYEKELKKQAGNTNREFTKIERRGKQLETRLAGIGKSAFLGFSKGAIGAATSLLSVSAVIAKTKDALMEFGNIADQAFATGLDPEFLQGITYQMSLFGVSTEQGAAALAVYAKNSGLAIAGKGRLLALLKEENPALLENIRSARNQEERVRLIADALSKETDAAKRAALATAAFGSEGAKIAGAFLGGSAAIDQTMAKARELGIVIDRELIAKADKLGDEFDTATQIVDKQLKQALINIAPILVWLAKLTSDWFKDLNTVLDLQKPLAERSSSTLRTQLGGLRWANKTARDAIGALGIGMPEGADDKNLGEQQAIIDILRRRGMRNSAPRQLDVPETATLEEIETRNEAAAAAIKHGEAVKKLIADLEHERAIVGLSKLDQEIMNATRSAGVDIMSEEGLRIRELITITDEQRTAIEANTEAMEEFGDAAQDAVRTFIDDMIEGKSVAESFAGILGNLGSRFLDIGLSGLFDGGGGLFKGLFQGERRASAGRPSLHRRRARA